MGMSSKPDSGGSLAEINVTPLVDVMLVLLIIFMVTTPMMNQGIPVQLPKASQQIVEMNMEESSIVTVARDGKIYIDERPIPADKLEFILRRLKSELSMKDVFIRGDRRVPYGDVITVLDVMKKVGIHRVGMVTEIYEGP